VSASLGGVRAVLCWVCEMGVVVGARLMWVDRCRSPFIAAVLLLRWSVFDNRYLGTSLLS
jgi:hypothetical protein